MPECGIGLFPDVGSMWWMTRLLNRPVASYFALTGQRFHPADLIYTGLATHYVSSNQLDNLRTALADTTELDNNTDEALANVLKTFHETIPTNDCFLAINKESIEKTFQGKSVEEIISNLKGDDSAFSRSTLETLSKMSPTSMKLTFEGLSRGSSCKSIGEDLQMEYRMAKGCMRPNSDFFEGVRAILIEKDNSPKWNPSSLDAVTDEYIDEFFKPIDDEWEIPPSVDDATAAKL
jgi:enoyl-CoA hydratase/carnithine racemase